MIKAVEVISTIQGEGCDCGKRMLLLRFKTCNRICSYCDTIDKIKILKEEEYSLDQLQEIINDNYLGLLLTGGEITVEKHFEDSINIINNLNYPICNVETNGYQLIELIEKIDKSKNVRYMYSPKIFNRKELKAEVNRTIAFLSNNNVFIKVVYQENELINKYLEFLSMVSINDRVFLMPEGKTKEEQFEKMEKVISFVKYMGYNFSPRFHVLLWSDKRGV